MSVAKQKNANLKIFHEADNWEGAFSELDKWEREFHERMEKYDKFARIIMTLFGLYMILAMSIFILLVINGKVVEI